MKSERIMHCLNGIDDVYIEEAAPLPRKKKGIIRWVALTACVLMIALTVAIAIPKTVPDKDVPLPTPTVTAAPVPTDSADKEAHNNEELKITYEDPSDTIYSSSMLERYESFNTFDELIENSENLITGKCLSTQTYFMENGFMYTASQVLVLSTYKGELAPDSTITVVEYGGTCTVKEFIEINGITEKDFYNASSTEVDDKLKITTGIEGYYPMREGEETLLFLGSAGTNNDIGGPVYGVVGSTDGKLYKITETKYARPQPENINGGYLKEYSLQSALDNSQLIIDITDLSSLN